MTNRLTDTELWDKEWFQKLPVKLKCLFMYLCNRCDCAGVWEPNFLMATFIIGEKINEADILNLNCEKEQVRKLENGRFFIIDFISYQQKLNDKKPCLNQYNNAHKGIINRLVKNNIDTSPYIAPNEEQESPKKAPKKPQKVEYIKVEDIEFVNLTQDDFDKICEKNGKHKTLMAICKLDNWLACASTPKAKNARGKDHKDYFKTGNWVWGAEQNKQTQIQAKHTPNAPQKAVAERG